MNKDIYRKNRFYVGSDKAINANWGHETLEDAIEHARTILNKDDFRSETFIVEIIRVVRTEQKPVTVEEL